MSYSEEYFLFPLQSFFLFPFWTGDETYELPCTRLFPPNSGLPIWPPETRFNRLSLPGISVENIHWRFIESGRTDQYWHGLDQTFLSDALSETNYINCFAIYPVLLANYFNCLSITFSYQSISFDSLDLSPHISSLFMLSQSQHVASIQVLQYVDTCLFIKSQFFFLKNYFHIPPGNCRSTFWSVSTPCLGMMMANRVLYLNFKFSAIFGFMCLTGWWDFGPRPLIHVIKEDDRKQLFTWLLCIYKKSCPGNPAQITCWLKC